MKLEVGEFYLSACGEIVEIDDYCMSPCKFDLIAHIPKELHWSIVSQVYSYYKNVNARNKIIKRHKNFFNKKKIIIPG